MEDNLDRLLEDALREYVDVPIPKGLETRVVRHVRRAQTRRKMMAVAGVMSALAATVVLLIIHPTVQRSEPVVQSTRLIVPISIQLPELRITPLIKARRRVTTRTVPKQDRFPSSSPLTSEERTLLAMVDKFPAEIAQAFARNSEQSARPIQIEPIVIPPLTETPCPGVDK